MPQEKDPVEPEVIAQLLAQAIVKAIGGTDTKRGVDAVFLAGEPYTWIELMPSLHPFAQGVVAQAEEIKQLRARIEQLEQALQMQAEASKTSA